MLLILKVTKELVFAFATDKRDAAGTILFPLSDFQRVIQNKKATKLQGKMEKG